MSALRLLLLLMLTFAAEGKVTNTWLQADLRPYYFQSGVHQGKGALESAQQLLIDAMPHYQHHIEWHTLVRRELALSQAETIACTFSMLKTVERSGLVFSDAVAAAPGYAIVTPAKGRLYQRFLKQTPTDLVSWLQKQSDLIGLMEAGRAIPDFVRLLNGANFINFPLQTNPIAMLAHGRADYWLEFPDRANYQLSEFTTEPLELRFIYIQPQHVSLSYVACSPATPPAVMQDINAALAVLLPQQQYQQSLYRWNDADTRQQLLSLFNKEILAK